MNRTHTAGLALALSAIAILLAAPAAGAQTQPIPGEPVQGEPTPDDSVFDQYVESIPGGRGEEPSITQQERAPLPAGARRELEELGPAGAAAAELAEIVGRTPQGDGSQSREREGEGGGGVLDRILDPVPGGFGALLPLLLVIVALLAIAFYIARRRAEATPEPAP